MRKVWAALLICIGIIRYMGKQATSPLRREHTLSVKDMEGTVRMMFISDVHNNRILQQIAAEDVDFIVIGGDFVDKRVSDKTMKFNLDVLKKMNKPIYFIPGNNDGEKASKDRLLAQYDVRVLSNETLETKGYSITGIDPYSGEEVLKPERSDIRPSLLIMHDPFLMKQMASFAEDYDVILTGHTHGGQIRFMDYGPYERGGWKTFEGKRIFVSEGYGTSLLPLRLETQSEYHVFVLQEER